MNWYGLCGVSSERASTALSRSSGERDTVTGVPIMRTLFELDSDIEIVNDPMEGMDDLSNQPTNDPDD